MKRILTLLVVFALSAGFVNNAFAQEETPDEPQTLFGSGKVRNGGYGSLVTKFSQIDGKPAFFTGAKGAWLINSQFSLGVAAYGLTSRHVYDKIRFVKDYNWMSQPDTIYRDGRLEMGWGGLQLGYINNSNDLIHFTASVLIGGGVAGYTTRISYTDSWGDEEWQDWEHEGSGFYACEPEAGVEINIVKFMRVELQAGYRFIWGSGVERMTDSKLSGATGSISLKFGKF